MVKIQSNIVRPLALFLAVAAISISAQAQQAAGRVERPSIRVTGEAIVTVKPDQAIIDIGVVTQAATAQAAASQNAQKTDAVISDLKRVLGASADIKTISYSVQPNYRYPRDGGQPTIAGYNASNTVQVKINDLNQVGKVIDTATQSGANNINALRFTLRDEQAARTQALQEAAVKARAKAQALATALGLRVQRILHVEEGGQISHPLPINGRAMVEMAQAAPTPIEAGTIEIRATVTMMVEIAQ
jgi:hypothetical protein